MVWTHSEQPATKVSLEHNTETREWGVGYYRPLAIHLSPDEPPQNWQLPRIDDAIQRRFWAQQRFGRNTAMNTVLESTDLPCASLCHESRSFSPG